jgi:hypothetical protein
MWRVVGEIWGTKLGLDPFTGGARISAGPELDQCQIIIIIYIYMCVCVKTLGWFEANYIDLHWHNTSKCYMFHIELFYGVVYGFF